MKYSSSQNMVLDERTRVVAHVYGDTAVESDRIAARIVRLLNADEDAIAVVKEAKAMFGEKPVDGEPTGD